ncbi:histidine--tRNA ligase [Candidatus Saccharibacteria bacterium]|nr:histidine--tRNA ligase [Candidatus Saccharibacteria bacterium]
MQKVNTAPLSGFMQLLPEDQIEFDRIKQVILNAHHRNGFLSIETPIVHRQELLFAKAGSDTEKQIYQLEKGDHKLALRFDLTVPLAAYVAENQSYLNFPFKASNIGKVYRGERSQRGRYREFYQCDADVIARGELDIAYDAEIIGLIHEIYSELNFGKFTLRVSNRKLLNGFLNSLGLGEKSIEVSRIIDDAEKISEQEFVQKLQDLKVAQKTIDHITQFINIKGESTEIIAQLRDLKITDEQFLTGLSELQTVMSLLAAKNVTTAKIDLMIVRGLDYYTGTVYETILNDHPNVGSVSSGGRYDNLTSTFSNETFQGVGGSIGLTRLFSVLKEIGIIKSENTAPADLLVIPMSPDQFPFCYKLATDLRSQNLKIDTYLASGKVAKKLSFADKSHIPYTIVVGENEVETNRLHVKNMTDGSLTPLDEFLQNR